MVDPVCLFQPVLSHGNDDLLNRFTLCASRQMARRTPRKQLECLDKLRVFFSYKTAVAAKRVSADIHARAFSRPPSL
jgi:hypothetical protein